ncbi:MAG: hypothetical protein JWL77_5384 [Chthonomonadaceae bacterium]|nr:hypothetical protein [Chthonomonadaceae bacterium]
MESTTAIPSIRPFQFDGDTEGMLKNSVNLYRGRITIPLPLVTMTGRNGLSVTLTALYQGILGAEATTWNMDAPTGTLGMGWELPLEQIVAMPVGTAAKEDTIYYLLSGGNRNRLIETDIPHQFVVQDYQFWSVTFDPAANSWTVRRESGDTYSYGGSANGSDLYVETSVRWKDWIGSSVEPGATAFTSAWNLRTISNDWGDRLSFAYEYDQVRIGAAGPNFTRACRLKTVVDVFGRQVTLQYALKTDTPAVREIQPPHVNPDGGSLQAFQDRYETHYLQSIDVTDFAGEPCFRVVIQSSTHNFGNSTDPYLYKRCIDAIYSQYAGAAPEPGLEFTYNAAEDVAPGSLKTISTPLGSMLTYGYGLVGLENAPTIIEIDSQPGTPRVWFGPDYVITTFQQDSTLSLAIYNWSGGWAKVPTATLSAAGKVEDLRVVAQANYFVLYYTGASSGALNTTAFVRSPYLPDRWHSHGLTETADRVVLGSDYFLVHAVDSLQVQPYRVTESGVTPESSVTVGSKDVALAASGNVFVAFAYNSSSHAGTASLLSRSSLGTWTRKQVQTLSDVFWDDWVKDAFWGSGAGFAAATYLATDEKTYRVATLQWTNSRQQPSWTELGVYPVPTTGKLPFTVSRAAESMIGNVAHLFRYDGTDWRSKDIAALDTADLDTADKETSARFAYGSDVALVSRLVSGRSEYSITTYDPYLTRWNPTRSLGSGDADADAPFPATAGIDYITVGDALFFRGAKSDWKEVPGARLGDSVNLNSVKNIAPAFILSEDKKGTGSNLVVLKNGTYVSTGVSPYLKLPGQRCYVPGDNGEAPGTVLVGNGSFVTYSGGAFGPGVSLKLYRVLDDQLDLRRLFATAAVVKTLTVSNGLRSYTTRYNYNEFVPAHSAVPIARGATFDASGRIAEFSKVSVVQGDDGATGANVKYFLNGVAPQERTVFYPPDDPYSNARAYVSLMNGVLVGETNLDSAGRPIEVMLTSWQATLVPVGVRSATYIRQRRTVQAASGVPLSDLKATPGEITMLDDGHVPTSVGSALSTAGMALGPLVEVIVFEAGALWLILDDTNDRAFPIRYDSTTDSLHLTATVRSTGIVDYNPRNGLVSQQSRSTVDARGVLQARVTQTLYLCDVLPALAAKRHLLSQSVQSTNWTSTPAEQKVEYTGAQANLYWSWAADAGSVSWSPTRMLEDTGPIDIRQTFVWHNADAVSPLAPTFDGWQNGRPDVNHWRRQLTVHHRSRSGQVLEKVSLDGVPASYLWDTRESQPIARFTNALISEGEASYFAFESNETNPGWLLDGSAPAPYPGDAHTGAHCARIPGGSGTLRKVFRPQRAQSYYFTCWIKTAPGFSGNAAWTFTRESDGQPVAAPIAIPDTGGRWQKQFRRIDLSAKGTVPAIVIAASNKTAHALLVDNLRFSPVVSAFQADAVDPATGGITATLDTNAVTTYLLVDYGQRAIGSAGPAPAGGWQTPFLWKSARALPDPARPNASLSVQARTDAVYGRFLPDSWQEALAASFPDHWTVEDRTLISTIGGQNDLTVKAALPAGAFALRLQVTPPKSLTAPISLRMRTGKGASDTLRIVLEPGGESGIWRLYEGPTAIQQPVPNPRSGVVEWALIASDRTVTFFVQGYRVFSYLASQPVGGPLEILSQQAGMALRDLLAVVDPIVLMQFQDNGGQPTQLHQVDGAESNVKETLYDAIGRPAVVTKTAALPPTATSPLAYVPDFAVMDWTSGKLTGLVDTYYSPRNPDAPSHDDGYPFSRRRFDDTPLNRVVETGLPGLAHAIRPDGLGHTARSEYGVGLAGPLTHALEIPAGQYSLVRATDPDGLLTFLVQNKASQVIAAGTALETGLLSITGSEYDAAGNLTLTRTPESYAPPVGSDPGQFVNRMHYDAYHAVVSVTSDTLQTDYVRDPAGRVRFMQDARGRAEGYYAYWTYDAVRRNIESGYVMGSWDPAALAARAANLPLESGHPDWPTADIPDVTWSKRLFYDGDGTQPNQIGTLDHSEVADAGGKGIAVSEAFTYGGSGRILESSVHWPVHSMPVQTVRYAYDAAGNLTAMSDDSTLDVTYQFDRANRVIGVGNAAEPTRYASYRYFPGGMISDETLNRNTIRLPRRYNSVWQLRQLGDAASPFQETLGFEVRLNGKPGYFNGQVASTAYALQWTGAPTGFSCEYGYDRLEQLTSAQCSDADWSIGAKAPISYDPNGNLLAVPVALGEDRYLYDGNVLRSFDSPETQAESFQYNPNKAVARVETKGLALTYDRTSGLAVSAHLDTGMVSTYTYTAAQQRSVEAVMSGGKETKRFFIYGADTSPLVEMISDGSGIRREVYVRGPMGLLAVETDTTYAVIRDHLGSTRVVLDSVNRVVAGYDYAPFGALLRSYGSLAERFSYRYTGQRWDDTVQLYDFGARLYDPTIRRFLSRDPGMQFPSPYLYAGNNPLSLIDPSGAFSIGAFFGALIGALEVAVGIVLQITATAILEFFSLGTATPAVIGLDMLIGGLIGAGAQAFVYSVTAGDNFSWGQWGIQEGIGATIGVMTAGFGALASLAGKGATAAAEAAGVGATAVSRVGTAAEAGVNILVGGGGAGVIGQAIQDAATGQKPGNDLGWAFLFGAVGGGIGLGTGPLANSAARRLTGAAAAVGDDILPRTPGWVISRAVGGGGLSAASAYVINGVANLVQGEDWNTNWASSVALGFTLGMVAAIPRDSPFRYRRLEDHPATA